MHKCNRSNQIIQVILTNTVVRESNCDRTSAARHLRVTTQPQSPPICLHPPLSRMQIVTLPSKV